MNLATLREDESFELDPETAWNLHVYVDGLRMEAESLAKHATQIDEGVMYLVTEQQGRAIYR